MKSNKKEKIKENDTWLFHPYLVNVNTGATGRYKPAGENMIEMEFIITKNRWNVLKDVK